MDTKFVADDWGMNPKINEAILDLARMNKLQGVSVMVNAPHSNYLLEELKQTSVYFSLHLNLTEGKPISEIKMLRLITNTGDFVGPLKLFFYSFTNPAAFKEMIAEGEKQIQRARDLLGDRLIEVDGHHHSHLIPKLLLALLPTILETHITRVRIPSDWRHFFSAFFGSLLLRHKRKMKPLKFIRYGYFYPHLIKKSRFRFEYYLCHPGLDTFDHSSWGRRRLKEFTVLESLNH